MPRYQKSGGFDRLNVSNLITTSSKQTVESLVASSTLDANDSGKIFTIDLAAGAIVITLPTPGAAGAGWSVTIIQNATHVTASNTIIGATNIWGALANSEASVVSALGTGETTITLVVSQAVVGDKIHLISTGTTFIVSGTTAVGAAVTIA